jgi:hypothetical protein
MFLSIDDLFTAGLGFDLAGGWRPAVGALASAILAVLLVVALWRLFRRWALLRLLVEVAHYHQTVETEAGGLRGRVWRNMRSPLAKRGPLRRAASRRLEPSICSSGESSTSTRFPRATRTTRFHPRSIRGRLIRAGRRTERQDASRDPARDSSYAPSSPPANGSVSHGPRRLGRLLVAETREDQETGRG